MAIEFAGEVQLEEIINAPGYLQKKGHMVAVRVGKYSVRLRADSFELSKDGRIGHLIVGGTKLECWVTESSWAVEGR